LVFEAGLYAERVQIKMTTKRALEFRGVRLQIDTHLNFDEVLRQIREACGKSNIPQINEVAVNSHSAEEFDAEVKKRFEGLAGFMIFGEIEHTRWIAKYGINRRVLRIILGNPLIAITMLREDISAGLFVPVELLLVENGSGSTVHYIRPSSLMVTTENPLLKAAAEKLDQKFDQLIATVTDFG
jgi:uncharacterized protein (DUF302 family)